MFTWIALREDDTLGVALTRGLGLSALMMVAFVAIDAGMNRLTSRRDKR